MKSLPILPFLPAAPPGDRSGGPVPGTDPGFAKTLDRYRQMPGPNRPAPMEPHRSVAPHGPARRPEPQRSHEPERPEPDRSRSVDGGERGEPADPSREIENRKPTDQTEENESAAPETTDEETGGTVEETKATTADEPTAEIDPEGVSAELAFESPTVALAALASVGTETSKTDGPDGDTGVDELTIDLEATAGEADPVRLVVDTAETEAAAPVPGPADEAISESGETREAAMMVGVGAGTPPADTVEADGSSAAIEASAPAVQADTLDLGTGAGTEGNDGAQPTLVTSGGRPVNAGPAPGPTGPVVVAPAVGVTTSTSVAPPVAAAVAGSTTAPAGIGTTAWEQVSTSIASTVRTLQDGSHRLLLRLHPEELGSVVMELTVSGGRVDVRLLAQQVGTRDLLSQTADELRQDLDQNGLSLGSMDVDLERGPESESTGDETADLGDSVTRFEDGSAPSRRSESRLATVRRSDSTLDLDL
ncbi:MAG: hypothetical protein GY929_22870 [Actinomycetia bacterium]|nr:hypothetical protein [Actinomycetes bacterium]